MPDPIETALQRLRGQEPPGGFASAEAIRRRGVHRTYRQLVAAGVAVLAVAGGVVTFVASQADRRAPEGANSSSPSPPSPSGSASPSGSSPGPQPVTITPAMFLTAADLGPGRWVIEASSDQRPDSWPWQDICKPYRRADYPSLARRAQKDWRDFSRTDGAPMVGVQIIERYEPGAGPGNLDDVRARLRHCAGMQSTDPVVGNPPFRWTVIANGFVGDDAVLVKNEMFPQGEPVRVYFVVAVRVGDLVTSIWLNPGTSEATARDLAAKAATRLR
jgi:hypothetical protein